MFMKKRDANNDNVILFPGLEKRLLEKGLDYLKLKKYRDAIDYLEQALLHDPENGDIYVGLVLANFEAGKVTEAKQLAEEMLRGGIGDYIQVIDLYLMILVQLNEYTEIVSTVEALLEEKEVPVDKYEHFARMLEFGRRMLYSKTEKPVAEEIEVDSEEEFLDLFAYEDPKDQVMLAARLAKGNIRPFINEIKEYVSSEAGHPFQKTMLLNILREQQYSEEIQVRKLGWEKMFNPERLPDMKSFFELSEVGKTLSSQVENEDPVLYENVIGLLERHYFLLYPFQLPEGRAEAWAAAYHFVANEYFGFDDSLDSFADLYNSSIEEAEQALTFITKLEEISSPII
jgi:tetratricopeptide (TPR) repeat protein